MCQKIRRGCYNQFMALGKMDKTLRNILIFGIIVVSASVSYFLLVYLPNKDKAYQKQLTEQNNKELAIKEKDRKLALQEKCSIDGEKYINDLNKGYTPGSSSLYFSGELYSYDDKLNTCLTYIYVYVPKFFKPNEKCNSFIDEIVDVYSKRTIAKHVQGEGKDKQGNCVYSELSKDQFDKLKTEYFGK